MATVLALLSSLAWGSSDFLGGQASKRYPVFFVVLVSQVFGLALMLIIATATSAWGTSLDYLPWAVLASVSGFTGIGLFYAAMATGAVGVVSPITSLGSLGPIVLGLFAGDTPTAAQYAGLLCALVGVVLASGPELSGETGSRSVLLALAATVLFGVCLIAIAFGSQTSAVMTMTGMRVSTVAIMLCMALALLARGHRVHIDRRIDLGVLAAVGLLDVTANLLFGIASTAGMLSLVSVLGSLYPVVTVLLAWRFLHERLRPIQYLGVGLALGGVAAIVA